MEAKLARGNSFCEWGSGFGVVTSLAGMLGFDAYGIEIDRNLYDASRSLASEFELPVQFIHGNFVPRDGFKTVNEFATEGASAYQKLGLDVYDFDVVFAYPWPSEEREEQRYWANDPSGMVHVTTGMRKAVDLLSASSLIWRRFSVPARTPSYWCLTAFKIHTISELASEQQTVLA